MNELLDRIRAVFPVTGDGFIVELLDLDPAFEATLRITVLGEDPRERRMELLPAEHRYQRGIDLITACADVIRDAPRERIAALDPSELILPEILGLRGKIDRALVERIFDDPRARRILAVARADDQPFGFAQMLATLDPASHPPPACLTNPELEAPIVNDPGDREAHAVYADWLSDRGDPRGELIALQLQLTGTGADSSDVIAAAAKLQREHAYAWLGELAWSVHDELALRWKNGWLHGATVLRGDGEAMVRELLGCTSVRFLHELDVQTRGSSFATIVTALAELPLPRTLRRLSLSPRGDAEIGDITALYPKLGVLTHLALDAAVELGAVWLPSLRAFRARTPNLTADNLKAIYQANWPELERLEIGVPDLADIEWVFANGPPRLKHLGLHFADADAILARLVESPLFTRLEVLDLSYSEITAAGIARINEPAFRRLIHIMLSMADELFELRLPRNVRIVHLELESRDED